MKNGIAAVFACVGAVIGAGFASGREIAVFFSRYGGHSWWLILLSAVVMVLLCRLCMRCGTKGQEWTEIFEGRIHTAALVSCVLMAITAGAMIAAAGHLMALVWNCKWAYGIGTVCTLLMAWKAGERSLRVLEWLSAVLSILLVGVLLYGAGLPEQNTVILAPDGCSLPAAAIWAASYAGMNIMLSVGVVCASAGSGKWVPWVFGLVILVLLGVSNALYLRHPELLEAPFPIVVLLSGCGKQGFLTSAALLYLSVFTTLTAVLYALRGAMQSWIRHPALRSWTAAGLPLIISSMGFSDIVDRLYAPAGLICLLVVFIPLAVKQRLDFSRTIQYDKENGTNDCTTERGY